MDLLVVRKGTLAVSINAVLTDSSGVVQPPDPSTLPVADFYTEDPLTGTMALDVSLGSGGHLNLVNLFSQEGFYGAPVELALAVAERYLVVIRWVVSGVTRIKYMRMYLSDDLKTIYDGAITTPSSRATLLAP